jgi:hypothetical protein
MCKRDRKLVLGLELLKTQLAAQRVRDYVNDFVKVEDLEKRLEMMGKLDNNELNDHMDSSQDHQVEQET